MPQNHSIIRIGNRPDDKRALRSLAKEIDDGDSSAEGTDPVGKPAFYRQIAQMDLKYTDEVQDRYSQIRCPVMLLWGPEDQWIPLELGRKLAAMIPDRTFLEIPDSGHLMQEDAPEAIIAAACRFFGAAATMARASSRRP